MNNLNVLLLCGGDSSEHQISIISANYLKSLLDATDNVNVTKVVMHESKFLLEDDSEINFNNKKEIVLKDGSTKKIDVVIPCIHGFPGETGDIQAFLEILDIPYVGCKKEASLNCFNKVTTKLYLDAFNIKNSPFCILTKFDDVNKEKALNFFSLHQDIYVKAASQGSSVGCYHVKDKDILLDNIKDAFNYSDEVILEKTIVHRELEVATYEFNGDIVVTNPGEVIIPENAFYSYEEKYSKTSGTVTTTDPKNLDNEIKEKIKEIAREVFVKMKLRHISRVDFFLTPENEIIVNEINTFPGMTPISLFPQLLTANGHNMTEFLLYILNDAINNK